MDRRRLNSHVTIFVCEKLAILKTGDSIMMEWTEKVQTGKYSLFFNLSLHLW